MFSHCSQDLFSGQQIKPKWDNRHMPIYPLKNIRRLIGCFPAMPMIAFTPFDWIFAHLDQGIHENTIWPSDISISISLQVCTRVVVRASISEETILLHFRAFPNLMARYIPDVALLPGSWSCGTYLVCDQLLITPSPNFWWSFLSYEFEASPSLYFHETEYYKSPYFFLQGNSK